MNGRPVKPFKTIREQIELLESRGLALDPSFADQWLKSVGYYRLSGYWYPYRELDDSTATRLDTFVSGTDFEQVTNLYEFDRKLRTIIHDGIERVEVALRSHLSYVLGEYGALAYQETSVFRPAFNHAEWISTARDRTSRARRHSEPIRHYEARYGGALPIWVLVEVLDFSDVSRLYDGLLAREQWRIAERLGVEIDLNVLKENQRNKVLKTHPFARWLEQFSILRNTSAHHSRVWNRSFAPVSTAGLRTISELRSLPIGQSERLYGALTLIGFLLREISPGTSWTSKVRTLIEAYFNVLPNRAVEEMGFPPAWRDEVLWMNQRT